MTLLILGLVLFLGVHSVRIVADGWRTRMRQRLGEGGWKGLYSLLSLAGLALVIWGVGLARQDPVALWTPPVAMRHVASLLTLAAFILLAAAYVPRNALKARLHHPMVLAVKVWALAHLLSNGNLADVLLFGGFLLWAVLDFRAARQRDRAHGTRYPTGTLAGTAAAVVLGSVAWAVFAFWGHALLIGVSPMGR
ncbi:MAG: NnrU family protein [Giesbergeria sp.]